MPAATYGRVAPQERGLGNAAPGQASMVPAGLYYETYHGHRCQFLEHVFASLQQTHGPAAPAIFLAGDSSLDNKTWLFNQGAPVERWQPPAAHAPATNGYEHVLRPPRMVCDVSYWMNQILEDARGAGQAGCSAYCVNTAIEATLLASRVGGFQCCCLPACPGDYSQDAFIRDNIRPQDMLVISVGGNDIALAPSIFTILALVLLMLTPWPFLCSWHPGVLYFRMIFQCCVQRYADELTSATRPAKIACCMIYNLDEANTDSWANCALGLLCYCCFPSILQNRIDLAFQWGIRRIKVADTEVVPIRLADALDGKSSEDYHQRVEPSVVGGQKMARLILHRLGFTVQTPGYRYEKPLRGP